MLTDLRAGLDSGDKQHLPYF